VRNSRFDGAVLDGVRVEGVQFGLSSFVGASMVGISLLDSVVAGGDAANAVLRNARFDETEILATSMRGADLTDARFLDRVRLTADLRGARLVNADLAGVAGMTEANLAGGGDSSSNAVWIIVIAGAGLAVIAAGVGTARRRKPAAQ
jgi:uncharacterized protein YjbI with pentapeptide repeats